MKTIPGNWRVLLNDELNKLKNALKHYELKLLNDCLDAVTSHSSMLNLQPSNGVMVIHVIEQMNSVTTKGSVKNGALINALLISILNYLVQSNNTLAEKIDMMKRCVEDFRPIYSNWPNKKFSRDGDVIMALDDTFRKSRFFIHTSQFREFWHLAYSQSDNFFQMSGLLNTDARVTPSGVIIEDEPE